MYRTYLPSQKVVTSIGVLLGMFIALPVRAALLPCNGLDCKVEDLFELFVNIYNFLLGFAAVLAVLMLVFAGFRMLNFYWSEQPEAELEAAKNTIRRAIFGIIVILTAYLVVATLVYSVLGLDPGGPVGAVLQQRGLVAP